MAHIPFTLLAYFLNATAVTVDKFMLSKHIPNPLIYVFYFSAFSAIALFGLPFTHIPAFDVFLIASASTVLWTTGVYFMFKGLQVGQVDRVIPIIRTLIPVLLLAESIISQTISSNEILAVFLLILGLIALTITDYWKGAITKKEITFEILAAFLLAVSYLVLKQAYIRDEFFTVLVWSRFILLPVSILIFFIPQLRKQVFASRSNQPKFSIFSKAGLLFVAGQAAGGSSELLINFSISLANPALVNSLNGVVYIFLFIFSLILGRKYPKIFAEKYTSLMIGTKILGIIILAIGLYLLAFT